MVRSPLVTRSVLGGSLIIGWIAASCAAQAEWTPVPGRVLSQMVAGSTVVIDAPMGFKLPIQHADDGSMSGEAGGLSFYLGSATDTGRWWIAGDRLCYRWTRWFKSEARCMKVRRDGSRIEWEKEDGESGTASLTLRKVQPVEQQIAAAEPPKPASATRPVATTPAAAQSAQHTNSQAAAPVAPAKPSATTAAPTKAPMPTRAAAAALPAAKPSPAAGPRIAMQQTTTSYRVGGPPPPYRVGGPPPPAYRVISVAADDVLNVRQGPSAEHPAIAALEPEARGVRMIGPCQGDWCFVRHQDIVGWVHRYYLEEMQTSPSR